MLQTATEYDSVQNRALTEKQLPKSRAPSALRLLPVLVPGRAPDRPKASTCHGHSWRLPLLLILSLAFLGNAERIDVRWRIAVVETGPALRRSPWRSCAGAWTV